MKKKVLALLLALVMVAAIGCTTTPEATTSPTATPAAQDTQTPENTEPVVKTYDKQLTIENAAPQITAGIDYNTCDDITLYITEKFNIQWEINTLNFDNMTENTRIWANANDLPDMVTFSWGSATAGDLDSWVDADLVRRLPDDWKTRWPDLASVFKGTVLGEMLEERYGGTYYLPKIIFNDAPTNPQLGHGSIHIRKDWAAAVGVELKEVMNIDEVLEYARLVKTSDPGNQGTNLRLIDASTGNMLSLFISQFNPFYASPVLDTTKNEYVWGIQEYYDDTYRGMKLMQDAHKEGLIYADWYNVNDYIQVREAIYSGLTAVIYDSTDTGSMLRNQLVWQNAGLGSNYENEMASLVLVNPDDGMHKATASVNYWTGQLLSPNMDEEKAERILDFLDWLASDEGQDLIRMGFEGKDYTRNSDGTVTITREKEDDGSFKTVAKIYPSINPIYYEGIILTDDFSLRDPTTPQYIRDMVNGMYSTKQKYGYDMNPSNITPIDWERTVYSSSVYDQIKFTYSDELTGIIMASGDLDTNLKKWMSDRQTIVDAALNDINTALGKK